MSLVSLLDELERAGIRLSPDGGDLIAEIQPGACLDCYRQHIVANKPTLLAILDLQEQIVTAATVEPAAFNREAYDALWTRWCALAAHDILP
jgi:hypothetical protein